MLLALLLPALPAAAQDAQDPLREVRAAFASGKPIPDGPAESRDILARVKDVALGCAAPCDTEAELAQLPQ